MIQYLGHDDSTTRRMLEEILADGRGTMPTTWRTSSRSRRD
jgi:hypothetical protein